MSKSVCLSDYNDSIIQEAIHSVYGLNKAGGEGSRGGHVIGHTKTGKAIYEDHGHGYTTEKREVSDEGSTGHVHKHGKKIGEYEFDRDSNAFWTKIGDKSHSFESKKEMMDAYKKHHGTDSPKSDGLEKLAHAVHSASDANLQSAVDKYNAHAEKMGIPYHEAYKKMREYGRTLRKGLDDKLASGQIDHLTFMKASVQLDNLLEKAGTYYIHSGKGEGSRGGKVIGHTRSGKAIYENFEHPNHGNFTPEDHLDASHVHLVHVDIHGNDHGNQKKATEHHEENVKHYREAMGRARKWNFDSSYMANQMDASQMHAENNVKNSAYHKERMVHHQKMGDKAKTTAERDRHYDFAHGHFKKHNDRKFLELMDDNSKSNKLRHTLLEYHQSMHPDEIKSVQKQIDEHHKNFIEGMGEIANAKFSHPKHEKVKK